MEVFRVSREKYARSLNASGAAGRWNKDGQLVIYTGESRSLSVLESVVHKSIATSLKYEIMVLSIRDDARLFTQYAAYPKLQFYGSEWYKNKQSLVLKVPSVIVPQEFNYVINTEHPDFTPENIALVRGEDFLLDSRLF
jgi:RES domain-containing protein